MNRRVEDIILRKSLGMGSATRIKVCGDSMLPFIRNGDTIEIEKCDEYALGDILVFRYKYGEFIAHRLLKFQNDKYLCKGDNSFRLEDIEKEQIIGKVCRIIHNEIAYDVPKVEDEFLEMSYRINREFRKNGYDRSKTTESKLYKNYENRYLRLNANISGSIWQLNSEKNLAEFEAVKKIRLSVAYKEVADIVKQIDFMYAIIKGAVISKNAYLSEQTRMSGDIDILIERKNVDRIKLILLKNGFVQGKITGNEVVPYSRREQIFQTSQSHQMAPFIKRLQHPLCPFVMIDVNVDIIWGESPNKINISEVLNNTEETEVCGVKINKLKPVHEFVVLCLHHYKDLNSIYLLATQGIPARHFRDIYLYIHHVSPDRNELEKVCIEWGVKKYVYYCLYYANEIYKTDLLAQYTTQMRCDEGQIILHQYGLQENEFRQWSIGFAERLAEKDLSRYLDLDEKALQKVGINRLMM